MRVANGPPFIPTTLSISQKKNRRPECAIHKPLKGTTGMEVILREHLHLYYITKNLPKGLFLVWKCDTIEVWKESAK